MIKKRVGFGRLKSKWKQDLGPISEDQWKAFLQEIHLMSLANSRQLSQLYLLHTPNCTPNGCYISTGARILLHALGGETCTLLHMFWSFPELFRYWHDFVDLVNLLFDTRIELNPLICILGNA